LLDNVTFSLDATGPKSQNMTLKSQQMLQLLQLAPNLVDPQTGQGIMKPREIVAEYLKNINIDPTAILNEVAE
jgi:hypothetical protein